MDLKNITRDARFFAVKMATQIATEANRKPVAEVAAFAGTCASITFQNIAVSILLEKHPPGSIEGEAAISELYEKAKQDALERWHKSDLKERGFGPRGRG